MPIPPLTSEGLLPPANDPYKATIDEVHAAFVAGQPCELHREQLFSAFRLHAVQMRALGFDRVWVDGGFVTRKQAPPKDIDLVYPAASTEHLQLALATPGIESLLTQRDVIIGRPMSVASARVQPMGGLVDAFLCSPAKYDYWLDMWSRVKRPDGTTDYSERKGFLEVAL